MASATFLTVTPGFPAGPNLEEGLRFYTEPPGFAITCHGGGIAEVRIGGVEINLIEKTDRNWAENASASLASFASIATTPAA